MSIIKVVGKRLTKQQNHFGFFLGFFYEINVPCMTNVSAPQEGFKGFANARHGGQHCESFAVHIVQVWLMDQVATPLWTE